MLSLPTHCSQVVSRLLQHRPARSSPLCSHAHRELSSRPSEARASLLLPGKPAGLKHQRITRRKPLTLASAAESDPATSASVRSTSSDKRQLGIVVTGGTKGFGYALVREFLCAGDRVVLCGRTEARVAAAVASLLEDFPGGLRIRPEGLRAARHIALVALGHTHGSKAWLRGGPVSDLTLFTFRVACPLFGTLCFATTSALASIPRGILVLQGAVGVLARLARSQGCFPARVVRPSPDFNLATWSLFRAWMPCAIPLVQHSLGFNATQHAHQPDAELYGIQCNVQSAEDMAELARFSCDQLGTIDRWINNAGVVSEKVPLFEVSTEDIATVCSTNVLGSMLGCREAILTMRAQADSPVPVYHVFNFGFSAWGALFSSSTCSHKATKKALAQLTTSLSEELTKAGVTSVGVHNLSPGMVVTDLLLKGSTPVARRFFNVLAEEAETVAATLAPQVRQVSGTNGSLEYLSLPDAFRRVVTGVPQIINGGRFFDKEGNRVPERGAKYQENGVRKWYEVPAEEELV
ncbi:chlorophyll(ide) b reductase, variant 2 [Cymbomonas tetramitiformis]|uniref:Chlorophyll(Ide) b reductase, variant 2 n=1 Tax=Cymbomonas tetramitiformis TaxID=36881 RepID=A0AAE0BMD0_9CHLO|nr:chlorophyll(ide) b reductase, variant 2 [Cymbomonas tetramitiformis]